MRRRREWWTVWLASLAVFLLLAVLSFSGQGLASNYLLGVLLIVLIYALFSLGLSLEFGYTGLLNFGHVAFMAIGAYGVATLSERWADAGLASRLEGMTAAGAAVALLMALVAGALAVVPALALVERLGWRRRRQLLVAYGTGAFLALLVLVGVFPLSPRGAEDAVVFVAVLAAVALAALGGLLLGLPAIRLREDYLAIVTIGAAEIVRSVALNAEPLTRGTLGFQQLQRPIVEWALASEAWGGVGRFLGVNRVALAQVVVAALVLAYAFVALDRLSRSPWGRVLRAVREDEEVAASLGKNTSWYKLQALMIGSSLAAVAGILLVWSLSSVYPDHFPHLLTFFAFTIVILGGYGNHKGVLVGAVLLWGIFETARNLGTWGSAHNLAGPPQAIAVGLLLILIVLFRPQGIMGRKEELVHGR